MRTTSVDVLVIGGGIAGVSAALAAAEAGSTVALVRSAPGATALSSGGWDGPLPGLLADALAGAGLRYVPAPHPLPHPMGDLRSYGFAAESHACPLPMDGAVVCGIAGLSGFVAPALSRLYATSGAPALKHATANAPNTPPAGWAPHSLAGAIERDPESFAGAIGDVVPRDATHVLLPAVLGIHKVEEVRAAIADRIGIPVYECLGAPPSIPGWRLDRALLRALDTAGIEVIHATVVGIEKSGDRITHVKAARADETLLLAANRFVLATGKFLGGGIAAHDQNLIETALALPVWIEHLDQSFNTAESLTLTSRVRTYDQPLLRAGVHTNTAHQPIDARQRVLYSNVIAAGSALSGTDANLLGLGNAAAGAIDAIRSTKQGTR